MLSGRSTGERRRPDILSPAGVLPPADAASGLARAVHAAPAMHYLLELWLIEADPTTYEGLYEAARVSAAFEGAARSSPDRVEAALGLASTFGDAEVSLSPTLAFDQHSPALAVVGRRVPVPDRVVRRPDGVTEIAYTRHEVSTAFEAAHDGDVCAGVVVGVDRVGAGLRPVGGVGWLPGGPGVDVDWTGCAADGWTVLRPAAHLVVVTRLRSSSDADAVRELLAADVVRRAELVAPWARRGLAGRRRAAERLLGLRGQLPGTDET